MNSHKDKDLLKHVLTYEVRDKKYSFKRKSTTNILKKHRSGDNHITYIGRVLLS